MAGADAVDAHAAGAVLADGAPLHGEVARELDDGGLGRVVRGRQQALVGDEAGHAGDEADAAARAEAEHLARDRARRHEDARVVDRHHVRGVLGRVLGRRRDLLDPRRRDGAVEALVLVRDRGDQLVQVPRVLDVLLPVVQRPAPFRHHARQGAVPLLVGLLGAVQAVYCSQRVRASVLECDCNQRVLSRAYLCPLPPPSLLLEPVPGLLHRL